MANWWDNDATVTAPAPAAAPATAQMAPAPSSSDQWWANDQPVTFNAPDATKPLTIKGNSPDPDTGTVASAVAGAIDGIPIIGAPLLNGLQHTVAWARSNDYGTNFDDELNRVQSADQKRKADHPVATLAGNVAGAGLAMAPVVAVAPGLMGAAGTQAFGDSLVARSLVGGASGSVLGGTDSAIRSGGDPLATTIGVGTGALGGLAGPTIGRVIGAGADAIAQNRALRGIGMDRGDANMLMRIGANEGALNGQGVANIQAAGPDAMLVDATPGFRQVLDTALQRGGGAAQEARQAVEDRAARAGQDLRANLNGALGEPEGVRARTNAIRGETSGERSDAYNLAFNTPIDYASEHGQALEDLFRRIPASEFHQANHLMTLDGLHSQQIMMRELPDGGFQLERYPDVRQLNYIKQSLDSTAKAENGKGALGGTTPVGRAYGNLATDLRNALVDAVPAYGDALTAARDPIRAVNAMKTGYDLLKPGTMRDVAAEGVQQLRPEDMTHARQGLRAYIDDQAANVRRTATDPNVDARQSLQTLKDLSSDAAQQKLGMLVQDPASAAALQRSMERVAIAQELRASIARNSGTFARQATDEAVKASSAPGVVGRFAEGKPLEAGKRAMQFITQSRPEDQLASQDATYGRLVRALVNQRGAQAAQFLQSLQDAHGQISRTTGLLATPDARRHLATALLSAAPVASRQLAPSGSR